MRGQVVAAGVGVLLHLTSATGQYQPPNQPRPFPVAPGPFNPAVPMPPRPLPPGVVPGQPIILTPLRSTSTGPQSGANSPSGPGMPNQPQPVPQQPTDAPLPYPEEKFAIDPGAVTLKRIGANWQVWAGPRLLKDLGNDEDAAKDVVRVIRELRPTEWCAIGSPRPVVEYGLTNGKPSIVGGFPRGVTPIDLKSIRVEPLRGVWCLRDNNSILFNFGPRKPDADQALAVVRKYGFNRIGAAGLPGPALAYFFAAPETDAPTGGGVPAALQESSLTRTGIPVPGVGFVGEMVKIDPRKVEARKDGFEWVVAHGPDVFARFGAAEWQARDAVRVVQDSRFTEFCKFGTNGLTFFLVNGKAPTRVPFSVQGRRFDLNAVKVQQLGDRWAVTENGRHLFDVTGPEEGETLVRILKAYQFDQLCQVGQSPRASLFFLARAK